MSNIYFLSLFPIVIVCCLRDFCVSFLLSSVWSIWSGKECCNHFRQFQLQPTWFAWTILLMPRFSRERKKGTFSELKGRKWSTMFYKLYVCLYMSRLQCLPALHTMPFRMKRGEESCSFTHSLTTLHGHARSTMTNYDGRRKLAKVIGPFQMALFYSLLIAVYVFQMVHEGGQQKS